MGVGGEIDVKSLAFYLVLSIAPPQFVLCVIIVLVFSLVCFMPYVFAFALCFMLYALCFMLYALCFILFFLLVLFFVTLSCLLVLFYHEGDEWVKKKLPYRGIIRWATYIKQHSLPKNKISS